MKTRIKICGLTRDEDVDAAVAAGADAIGFVFWHGTPRCVDPGLARSIAAALPPFLSTVGLFVDPVADDLATAERALDLIAVDYEVLPAITDMDEALQANGFKFIDTVRTWIYLDDLLEWYDDFNAVRTRYFNETGIFEQMVDQRHADFGAGDFIGMDRAAEQKRGFVFVLFDPIGQLDRQDVAFFLTGLADGRHLNSIRITFFEFIEFGFDFIVGVVERR